MTRVETVSGSGGRAPWSVLDLGGAAHRFVSATGDPFDSADPASLETVARVPSSTPADVEAAVERSRSAFRTGPWARDAARRARVLAGFAAALRGQADRLAELLTREQGKTLFEARTEIAGSADMVDYYAGLARACYGRAAVLGEHVHGVILREPVGVVAVITPWNWPLTLLVRSLAPALAAGNACVVKPASLTCAITVEALALLDAQPELPEGVLTCVLGSGAVVGDRLVGHEGVDMIAFTGETGTGVQVMQRAAPGLRKVALELGGKSPNVVFADANLDKALAGAENAIFTTSGQICTAGSRLLLEETIHDAFVERLAGVVRDLRVGDGLDPSTQLGPLVSASQQESVRGYVERGRREGTLVAEGKLQAERGHFVAPAVFSDLPADSALVREEIFGPVLVVQRFADEDEAVALANDSPYGLAAGLWTADLDRAWRVGAALEAGTVWINTYHHFYPEAEVGGYKTSGIGRQQGVQGLEEFTETKHLNFDASPTLW